MIEQIQPLQLFVDFSEVGFMDSSGIGLIMGRFKAMQAVGGRLVIQNPSQHIRKVMRLAGLDRLATINTTDLK